MICKKCGDVFKTRVRIEGKYRTLQHRKYCLSCSPFGCHNTRKIELSYSHEPREKREAAKYKKWQRKARKERKTKLIEILGGKCVSCGYSRCTAALDFHHKNEKLKKFGIADFGLCRKWEKLVEEIKKCVLLCRNCHAELHSNGAISLPNGDTLKATTAV